MDSIAVWQSVRPFGFFYLRYKAITEIVLQELGRPLGVDDNDIEVDLPLPFDDVDLPAYYEGKLPESQEPSLMQGFVALTALYKIAGQTSPAAIPV